MHGRGGREGEQAVQAVMDAGGAAICPISLMLRTAVMMKTPPTDGVGGTDTGRRRDVHRDVNVWIGWKVLQQCINNGHDDC